MAISKTLSILITLITLTCPNRCISQPRNLQSFDTSFVTLLNKKTADIVSRVVPVPKPASFLANISIGNPPVPQLLLIDTGTDLTWIQCRPCKCYPRTIPHFYPSRSSTYRNASCESSRHHMRQIFRDEKTKSCRYNLKYRDDWSTGGVLGQERFTFESSNVGLIAKPDIVFGCGQAKSGYTQYSGVLGLGPGNFSIVTRNFDSRFSYCFGSLTNPTYPHNNLILGNGAKTEGNLTPLKIFQNRYYLDLQAISFGDKLLDFEPNVFKRHGTQRGTVIDTSTSQTILAREAYDTLFGEIDFFLGETLTRVEDWDAYNNPCYDGNMKVDLYGFPVVTLSFARGAELELEVESLFVRRERGDSFCLAMNVNKVDDVSVIGAMAQQNYNVGYDLRNMLVYFQKTDCERL